MYESKHIKWHRTKHIHAHINCAFIIGEMQAWMVVVSMSISSCYHTIAVQIVLSLFLRTACGIYNYLKIIEKLTKIKRIAFIV